MVTLDYMFYALISFWTTFYISAYIFDNDDVVTRPKQQITKEKVNRRLIGNVCATIMFLPVIPYIPELIVYNNMFTKYICTALLAESWFHFTHLLLHTKYLYFLHADHHAFITSSSFGGLYCSFFEMIFVNLGSAVFPLAIAGNSFSFWEVIVIFNMLALNVVLGHSQSYKDPYWKDRLFFFIIDNRCHEIHHKYLTKNYGSLGIFDYLLGTYQKEVNA